MTFDELETTVKKHMLLADTGIVRLLCGFVVAARILKINPPWLFIVGPPSGGKSIILKALEKVPGVKPLDDLNNNTFASGMKRKPGEKSNSLLDALMPGDIITFKDFTTILGKDKDQRSIVISQMRKIYDGDFIKKYGNGTEVKWNGRISVLSGVTTSVYSAMEQFADMGERFLMYVFEQPDRKEFAYRSTLPRDNPAIDEEMRNAFKQYLDSIKIPNDLPELDEDTKKEIAELSEFATRVRSRVERDFKDKVKRIHSLEMPGRFTTQLISIAYGLMSLNEDKKLSLQDKKILYKLALDSIDSMKRVALQELSKFMKVETGGIAPRMRLPVDRVRMTLQDLATLGVVDWEKTRGSNRDKWKIKDEYRNLIAKFDGIEMTPEILQAQSDDDDVYLSAEPIHTEPEFIDPLAQKAAELFGGEIVI